MKKSHTVALQVVAAHWIVAVGHLFLAARILPAPNNHVSWLAIILISSGHLGVSTVLWKLSDRPAGLISLMFFLAALGADLYEHFLHVSLNNIFMLTRSNWTAGFDASVIVLLALEIMGCAVGTRLVGTGPHPRAA